MAFTISTIEKSKVNIQDANGAFIGERWHLIADILLDDYLELYGLTLNAAAFGFTYLNALFIQSVDVNGDYSSDTVAFDWDPSTGTLMAYQTSDGAAVADDGLANMYIRVYAIGS
ncbi:MAG TPA: hypothetical protein VMX15_03465 [Candidatus Heimdallarchaeota archaeon]|nr:hypothetical protein [Candidatus Heimdallarchaeota archaeon]